MKIYDATLFDSKPADLGLLKIKHWNAGWTMPEGQEGLWFLDMEHLDMGSQEGIKANMAEYLETMRVFKEKNPMAKVGWYGICPFRMYNINWKPDWKLLNRMVAPIAAQADFIMPSLYTFYEDQDGWVEYAIRNIREARQYHKPILPFLWFEYHQSTGELKGIQIPGDYWKLQLETISAEADGCIIWGGYKRDWDDSAEWWLETMQFMQE